MTKLKPVSLAEALGVVVRSRRQALRLSQETLALNAEIDRSFLSEIERGLKSPTIDSLSALARALTTTPSELLRAAELTSGWKQ